MLQAVMLIVMLMVQVGEENGELLAPTTEESQASVEHDLDILHQLDALALDADYEDVRLSIVAADLSQRLPAPIILDRESLRMIGVRDDDRVTLRVGMMPAMALLDALARELASGLDQPRWDVHRGAIVLTSEIGMEAMRSLMVYDVRDLVADETLLGELRATRAKPPPQKTVGEMAVEEKKKQEQSTNDQEPVEAVKLSRGHELLLIVLEHLDPDAWVDMGGSRATITDHNGLVVVTAPARLHRQFRDALRRLRDSQAESLRLEAKVIDIPSATFARLSKEFHHEGELAVALMRDAEAVVRWQATGTVATGSTLSISSAAEERRVKLDIKATYNRGSGALNMEIDALMASGADQRAAQTSVQFQFAEGAAILELAPAEPCEVVRLLIVRSM